jgi:hypothetical protein
MLNSKIKITFCYILFEFFKIGPTPLFLFYNTPTMHMESIVHNGIAMITYILAGFEPGPSVPEVDAMSDVPRRRGEGTK